MDCLDRRKFLKILAFGIVAAPTVKNIVANREFIQELDSKIYNPSIGCMPPYTLANVHASNRIDTYNYTKIFRTSLGISNRG